MSILQEAQENSSTKALLDQDLVAIREQINEWDRQFGPGKVTRWILDQAFYRLYQAEGFKNTNKCLTELRRALKRIERSKPLAWPPRCIGRRQPDAWKKRLKQPKRPQGGHLPTESQANQPSAYSGGV